MTRRRFIADEFFANRAVLTGDHANHLVRVLRARVGQEFEVSAGGNVRVGRILSVEDQRVEFELGTDVPARGVLPITVALAIFKFDRMEWAIEKCTELGVERIVPLIAHRTDTHLASASAKRGERWQRIALAASEQSRRAAPPQICQATKLEKVLTLPGGTRLVLAEAETELSLRDAVRNQQPLAEVVLAIGPEGGWTAEELNRFRSAGWISASLGQTILRTETAAIAATALVAAELTS